MPSRVNTEATAAARLDRRLADVYFAHTPDSSSPTTAPVRLDRRERTTA